MAVQAPSHSRTSHTQMKLVHFPRIGSDEPPDKPATPRYRNLLHCIALPQFPRHTKRDSRHNFIGKHISFHRKSERARLISLPLPKMSSQVEASPYSWPIDGGFNPRTTALVIIDMQKDFCSPGGYLAQQGYDMGPVREIIPRLKHMLEIFRSHGFTVYHTREGHRPDLSTLSSREKARSKNNASGLGIGDEGPLGRLLIRGEPGHDIIDELYPMNDEQVIDKPGRSAFQHTDFRLMLHIKGIKNLVICGVTTDVCVHSTMREANDNAFDCLLVEDATASSEGHLHTGALASVTAEGGIFGAVSSTSHILRAMGVEQPHDLGDQDIKQR